jgi:hypothetical protein
LETDNFWMALASVVQPSRLNPTVNRAKIGHLNHAQTPTSSTRKAPHSISEPHQDTPSMYRTTISTTGLSWKSTDSTRHPTKLGTSLKDDDHMTSIIDK